MTNNQKNSGFTLIETILAVLLLATAIAGPLTIAARSLLTATAIKDQITAYYLAQDALEYVRFSRDTNKLIGSVDWIGGTGGTSLTPCLDTVSANGCYLDSTNNPPAQVPTACPASGICPIYYDTANIRFTYDNTKAATPFTRTILISTVPTNANERTVKVSVKWKSVNGVDKTVLIQEDIFNWQ